MKRLFLLALLGMVVLCNGCAMFRTGEVKYFPGEFKVGDPGVRLVGKRF